MQNRKIYIAALIAKVIEQLDALPEPFLRREKFVGLGSENISENELRWSRTARSIYDPK